jgi:hypothetical protein
VDPTGGAWNREWVDLRRRRSGRGFRSSFDHLRNASSRLACLVLGVRIDRIRGRCCVVSAGKGHTGGSPRCFGV